MLTLFNNTYITEQCNTKLNK